MTTSTASSAPAARAAVRASATSSPRSRIAILHLAAVFVAWSLEDAPFEDPAFENAAAAAAAVAVERAGRAHRVEPRRRAAAAATDRALRRTAPLVIVDGFRAEGALPLRGEREARASKKLVNRGPFERARVARKYFLTLRRPTSLRCAPSASECAIASSGSASSSSSPAASEYIAATPSSAPTLHALTPHGSICAGSSRAAPPAPTTLTVRCEPFSACHFWSSASSADEPGPKPRKCGVKSAIVAHMVAWKRAYLRRWEKENPQP